MLIEANYFLESFFFVSVFVEMAKTANRKFRSVKRNKRRGFFSQRPAQIREEQGLTESSTLVPVAGLSSASSTSPVEEWKTPLSASTPVRENRAIYMGENKTQKSRFNDPCLIFDTASFACDVTIRHHAY